jgi:hypothetical protein
MCYKTIQSKISFNNINNKYCANDIRIHKNNSINRGILYSIRSSSLNSNVRFKCWK